MRVCVCVLCVMYSCVLCLCGGVCTPIKHAPSLCLPESTQAWPLQVPLDHGQEVGWARQIFRGTEPFVGLTTRWRSEEELGQWVWGLRNDLPVTCADRKVVVLREGQRGFGDQKFLVQRVRHKTPEAGASSLSCLFLFQSILLFCKRLLSTNCVPDTVLSPGDPAVKEALYPGASSGRGRPGALAPRQPLRRFQRPGLFPLLPSNKGTMHFTLTATVCT